MMDVMSHNKAVTKTILFLFLFLATIFLFECQVTVAKYEEGAQEVLKYQSNLALTKNEDGTLTLVSSDEKEAVLELILPRDQSNVGKNESSTYKMLLPDYCTSDVTDDIVFSDGEEERRVEITCNIEEEHLVEKEGERFLEVSVQVLESIHNEMHFLYKEYHGSEKIEKQKAETYQQEDKVVLQFKESLVQNILMNTSYQPYEQEIKAYIYDSEDPLHLPGIQINYQEYYQYTYAIEDNFVGYARTYYENRDVEEKNTMYFTESNPALIDEIFSYYLKTYYCFDHLDQYYRITNYIASAEKISSVILNGKTISGFSYSKAEGKLTIDDTIEEYLETFDEDYSISVYQTDEEHQKGTFLASVSQNQILSDSLKEKISLNEELINTVGESNDLALEPQKYFEVNDDENFIVIEIVREEKYSKITICPVTVTKEELYYDIAVSCEHIDDQTVDAIKIMDLMMDALQAERENDIYQFKDHQLIFQLKRRPEESETVNSPPVNANEPDIEVLTPPPVNTIEQENDSTNIDEDVGQNGENEENSSEALQT